MRVGDVSAGVVLSVACGGDVADRVGEHAIETASKAIEVSTTSVSGWVSRDFIGRMMP